MGDDYQKWQADLIRKMYKKEPDKELRRIEREYGLKGLGMYEVQMVLQAEQEREKCKGCQGLPCSKEGYQTEKNSIPRIEQTERGGMAIIRYTCKHYQKYLDEQRRKRLTEEERMRSATALKSARIPPRYLGKTLDDYKVDKLNQAAAMYARRSLELNCGAFFQGECGSGKTLLAAIIAQMWLRANKSVIFIKVPAMLNDLRATFNGEGKEHEIFQSMSRADLLVLDDLGMEKPTRFAGSTLCRIIDDRYDQDAATIVTSNYKLEQIEAELNHAVDGDNLNGSRLADRLKSLCRPLTLAGGSRR